MRLRRRRKRIVTDNPRPEVYIAQVWDANAVPSTGLGYWRQRMRQAFLDAGYREITPKKIESSAFDVVFVKDTEQPAP